MNSSRVEAVAVTAGLVYLMALGWSMTNLSYDIWGALIVVPVYGALTTVILRRMFRGTLRPVAGVMCWGLVLKLGGALARYWVGFEAYQGGIDAQAYHDVATLAADEVWSGDMSVLDVLPSGTGTEFVERFTSFVYTATGDSQLAGFVTFSMLAYVGLAFFVKAATTAVPGLAARKYASLCVLCPSLVYWPSSIGKEALMMLGLGVGTFGIALLLARRSWFTALAVSAAGLGFAGLIRPHMVGIWIAAAVPALVLAFVLGGRSRAIAGRRRTTSRLSIAIVLVIAAIGLSVVAAIAVRFLEPGTDESAPASFTEILAETQRRTAKSGSTFVPPSVSSPTDWPFAAVRTLTRPLPLEAQGIAQLFSAAEILALAAVYAVSWRRLINLPRVVIGNPFVAFVVTALFLGGLAFSSFANLGVLTRQKALLFPFLLLPICVPLRARRKITDDRAAEIESIATSVDAPVPTATPVTSGVSDATTPAPDRGRRTRAEALAEVWG